jgi:hypothetical protein
VSEKEQLFCRRKFWFQVATGVVLKPKYSDLMVLSTLSILQQHPNKFCPSPAKEPIKPILLASFGNFDLVRAFQNIITELRLQGDLTRDRVER